MFDFIINRLLGEFALLLVFVPAGLAVVMLVGGTDALMALGLSRSTAGTITASFVVVASIAGLHQFYTKAIDWD